MIYKNNFTLLKIGNFHNGMLFESQRNSSKRGECIGSFLFTLKERKGMITFTHDVKEPNKHHTIHNKPQNYKIKVATMLNRTQDNLLAQKPTFIK